MRYKSLLTFIDDTASLEGMKPILESAAASDLHLTVHAIEIALPNPALTYGYAPYGSVIIPDTWQEEIEAAAKKLSNQASKLEKLMQVADVSGSIATSFCEKGVIGDEIAKQAAVQDLAILPRTGALSDDIWARVLGGVLFNSPIGIIVSNDFNFRLGDCKHVFVAYDGGLEAMRAIHNALPLLIAAEKVTLGLFDPVIGENADGEEPGADVAAWLSRHGCEVTVQQIPSGGLEIGKAITRRAKELGADLVVMGAYGHSRLRQNILGGTTATMIEQKELPVFFSH